MFELKRVIILAGSTLFVSAAALAQTAPQPAADTAVEPPAVAFGGKGQWVMMGGSNAFDISHTGLSNSSAKYFDVGGELGLDAFVISNLSVGFDIAAHYNDDQGYAVRTLNETKSTAISAGVRFGFNVPLAAWISLYPRLTLGLLSTHSDTRTISASDGFSFLPSSSSSSIGPWLNLYVPLLFHPAPHFVLGIGPRIEHAFGVMRGGPYEGSQSTLVGAQFTVGGYFGGAVRAAGNAAPAEERAEPSFGEQGQTVFTLATSGSVLYRRYSARKGSNTNVTVAPSFDHFLVNNVSIGLELFVTHQAGTTLDSSGAPIEIDSTNVGFAPRVGRNLPLTGWLSLWPQAEVGFGIVDTNQTSASGTNQHSRKRSWVQLSAPLLLHPASHLFVGAGPYLSQELSDADQNGYENDATTLGADLVLGGWL